MKLSPIHLAFADDHALFRKGVAGILSEYDDIEVTVEAANGGELLDKLRQTPRQPDVCLLDISMPVMDGYQALAELQRYWPGIRVLVLSMYEHEFSVVRMARGGACGYISKSAEPAELRKAIRSVYEHGFYHSDVAIPHYKMAMSSNKFKLTEKEEEMLRWLCSELTDKEIADKMNLSTRTIEGYRDRLYEKLNIHNRMALALFAIRSGLVPINPAA